MIDTMKIVKRDGSFEVFSLDKIKNAVRKSFLSVDTQISEQEYGRLTRRIAKKITCDYSDENRASVEEIQDIVEQTLMEENYYKEAKSYILYRDVRNRKRKTRDDISEFFRTLPEIDQTLKKIERDFREEVYDLDYLKNKFEQHNDLIMDR